MALSISHRKGILNKHLCKNLFEENRTPVFLWRFEFRRKILNSNKESHWIFKSLRINCWNITQVIWICKMSTSFSRMDIGILLKDQCIKPPPLMFSWKCTNFLKQQKQPPEVFRKKSVLKSFAIFTRKHMCCSLFGVFGVNFIKKRLQHRYFPVNIKKFF